MANQVRDTSNSFINGLSQREYLRARFSELLGNRKIHQPDASHDELSSGLSASARSGANGEGPVAITAISRAPSSRLSPTKRIYSATRDYKRARSPRLSFTNELDFEAILCATLISDCTLE